MIILGKTVTISVREYDELLEAADWLGWLEAAGVDNWVGFGEAHAMRNEEYGVDDDDE